MLCNVCQLFAIQRTSHAIKRLQAHGMGVAIQTQENHTVYHKPLPTEENRSLLERTLAPSHSWANYHKDFSASATLVFSPTQFSALLTTLPYALCLKGTYHIEKAGSNRHGSWGRRLWTAFKAKAVYVLFSWPPEKAAFVLLGSYCIQYQLPPAAHWIVHIARKNARSTHNAQDNKTVGVNVVILGTVG